MFSSAVLIYFSLDIDFSERKEDIAQLLLRFPQTSAEQNNLKYRGHNYVILGSIQQNYWNRFSPLRFGANTNIDKYKVEDEAEQNNFKYCGHICVILGSRHETIDNIANIVVRLSAEDRRQYLFKMGLDRIFDTHHFAHSRLDTHML